MNEDIEMRKIAKSKLSMFIHIRKLSVAFGVAKEK
jgi:hypothetical protein